MPSMRQRAEITVPLAESPAYTRRKLRVATIGAGFSGLIFAHKIQHEHPELQDFIEHVIYEKLDGVGGTWRVNTYPGVQNDVPAHIYAFPFDPNPDWSHFYAKGAECLEYMEHVATKWNLKRDIRFNTEVVALDWIEQSGQWRVKLRGPSGKLKEELADVIISAQGFLSRWKWPAIPGIHDFAGHKVHSADWDHKYDYSGKRIGIIGNGSSAIQILPQVAKLPGTNITSFQRGPTWIIPSIVEAMTKPGQTSHKSENGETSGNNRSSSYNPAYTAIDRSNFAANPTKLRDHRKALQHSLNKGFLVFAKGSQQNADATAATIKRMRKALNYDEDLCRRLIPDWTLGCKRMTPGEGYLESFLLPNVDLVQTPITKITKNGIHAGEQYIELDVLVCATGFDVSNIPHYPVTGRDSITLAEQWKDEPESYLSLACPNMPNYFIFTGPSATVGHGTIIYSLDWSAEWMIKWLKKMSREQIRSICPKQDATDEFARYGDQIQNTLVWTGTCSSWYKNNRVDGRVTATWPGSAMLYREVIEEIRPEDFDIEYSSPNRFRFMGTGFTQLELQKDADLAFYVLT